MKKLFIILLILLLSAPANAITRKLCINGSAVAASSINLCTGGSSTKASLWMYFNSILYMLKEYRTFDFFVVIGQSNAVGHCTGTGQSAPQAIQIYRDGTFQTPLQDPTGADLYRTAATGSWHPAFCNKYYELTGRRPILLCEGFDSSFICYWNSTLMSEYIPDIAKALTDLNGSAYSDYYFKGIIQVHGESSQGFLHSGDYTLEQLKSCLLGVINQFQAVYPAQTFYITKTGRYYVDEANIVRAMQQDVADETGFVEICAENNRSMDNGWHYLQSTYNLIGEEIATGIAGLE